MLSVLFDVSIFLLIIDKSLIELKLNLAGFASYVVLLLILYLVLLFYWLVLEWMLLVLEYIDMFRELEVLGKALVLFDIII